MKKALHLCLLLVLVGCVAFAGKKEGKDARVASASPVAVPLSVAAAPTILFSEGFNDTSRLSPWPPAGWNMRNGDGNIAPDADPSDTSWYQSLSVSSSGLPAYEGVAIAAAYYGTSNGLLLDDWIITPNWAGTVDATAIDSVVFWCASRSAVYVDSLQIRVSTTNKNLPSFTTVLGYIQPSAAAWTRRAFKLPSAAIRYIGFRYLMYDGGINGANSDKVALDLVQVLRYAATAAGEPKNVVPGSYTLKQNYPNPFNPSTKISFALKSAGSTTLKVYNLLGQEVATLVNGEMPAGVFEQSFDASGMTTGVYLYKLTSGSYTETRKMMLVK
jgi:hypothetical protein